MVPAYQMDLDWICRQLLVGWFTTTVWAGLWSGRGANHSSGTTDPIGQIFTGVFFLKKGGGGGGLGVIALKLRVKQGE